jgi:hypothetical protein
MSANSAKSTRKLGGGASRKASGSELLSAWDNYRKETVALDIAGAKIFQLEDAKEEWNSTDEYFDVTIEQTLCWLHDGRWFRLSEPIHALAGRGSMQLESIPPHLAAELLLTSGIRPPTEIARFVRGRIISAEAGEPLDQCDELPKRYGPMQITDKGCSASQECLFEYPDNHWFIYHKTASWSTDYWSEIPAILAAKWLSDRRLALPDALAEYRAAPTRKADAEAGERAAIASARVPFRELNIAARDYLIKHAEREQGPNPVTIRELKGAIGHSLGTLARLPAWRVLMEERGKRKKGREPKAVALSEKVLASRGKRDAAPPADTLRTLIKQHQDEWEPSPLDDAAGPVRIRKRV